MKTKVNITITTIKSTDDYYGCEYEFKRSCVYIYKEHKTIIYPMQNVLRIVVGTA